MKGIQEQEEEEENDGGRDDLNEETVGHISADAINERSVTPFTTITSNTS